MTKREFVLGLLATAILISGYAITSYLENSNAML